MVKTYTLKGLTASLAAAASANMTFDVVPPPNSKMKLLTVRAISWAIDNTTNIMMQKPMASYQYDQTAGKIETLNEYFTVYDIGKGTQVGLGQTPSNIGGTLGVSLNQVDLMLNTVNKFANLESTGGYHFNYFAQNQSTGSLMLSVSFIIEVDETPMN